MSLERLGFQLNLRYFHFLCFTLWCLTITQYLFSDELPFFVHYKHSCLWNGCNGVTMEISASVSRFKEARHLWSQVLTGMRSLCQIWKICRWLQPSHQYSMSLFCPCSQTTSSQTFWERHSFLPCVKYHSILQSWQQTKFGLSFQIFESQYWFRLVDQFFLRSISQQGHCFEALDQSHACYAYPQWKYSLGLDWSSEPYPLSESVCPRTLKIYLLLLFFLRSFLFLDVQMTGLSI